MAAGSMLWRNWHQTVAQPVQRFEVLANQDESTSTIADYKATARRVQGLIQEATEQDLRLRAAGGGWSFTNVATTEGILLATQRLNYRFQLNAGDLTKTYPPDRMPVLLQGGISIADVNSFLRGRNQALPTSGASNGQTIAGALATGTHGAAIDVGAIPDYVVAIHLATRASGRTVWLERASDPILSKAALDALDVELIPSDDVFNAALVSVGCFGIILGVVIEPVPLYYLHAWRQPVTLDAAMWQAIHTTNFSNIALPGDDQGLAHARRRPHHFEVLCNVMDGARTVATIMYSEPNRPAGSSSVKSDGGIGKGDSALDVIGFATSSWDGLTTLAAKLLTRAYQPYANVAGTPGEVFKDTSTRGRSASCAMGVPVARAQDAFEIATAAVKAEQAPALVSMRFVKASRATLGFTMHDPVTCVLEVDGAYSHRTLAAQRDTWKGLEAKGIPHTFHWGKMNELNALGVRECYGKQRVADWVAARQRLLPDDATRRVFSNAFSDALDVSR